MPSEITPTIAPVMNEPKTSAEYLTRAWTRLAEQKNQEAEADFLQVIQMDSQPADAYYGLGLALNRAGHKQAARQAFQQAMDLVKANVFADSPRHGTILRNLIQSQIFMLGESGKTE